MTIGHMHSQSQFLWYGGSGISSKVRHQNSSARSYLSSLAAIESPQWALRASASGLPVLEMTPPATRLHVRVSTRWVCTAILHEINSSVCSLMQSLTAKDLA